MSNESRNFVFVTFCHVSERFFVPQHKLSDAILGFRALDPQSHGLRDTRQN